MLTLVFGRRATFFHGIVPSRLQMVWWIEDTGAETFVDDEKLTSPQELNVGIRPESPLGGSNCPSPSSSPLSDVGLVRQNNQILAPGLKFTGFGEQIERSAGGDIAIVAPCSSGLSHPRLLLRDADGGRSHLERSPARPELAGLGTTACVPGQKLAMVHRRLARRTLLVSLKPLGARLGSVTPRGGTILGFATSSVLRILG